MMNLILSIQERMLDLSSEAINWHQFIVIIVQEDLSDFSKSTLILARAISCIMQTILFIWNSIAGCEVNAGD